MARTEFTLCNQHQIEVMVGINTDTGKITDLYCYADNIPHITNPERGVEYKISTKPSSNELFVYIQRKGHIFKLLLLDGWVCLLDNEDTEYQTDVYTFEKACAMYNVPHSINVYGH